MTARTDAAMAAREWLHARGWSDPSADEVQLTTLLLADRDSRERDLLAMVGALRAHAEIMGEHVPGRFGGPDSPRTSLSLRHEQVMNQTASAASEFVEKVKAEERTRVAAACAAVFTEAGLAFGSPLGVDPADGFEHALRHAVEQVKQEEWKRAARLVLDELDGADDAPIGHDSTLTRVAERILKAAAAHRARGDAKE